MTSGAGEYVYTTWKRMKKKSNDMQSHKEKSWWYNYEEHMCEHDCIFIEKKCCLEMIFFLLQNISFFSYPRIDESDHYFIVIDEKRTTSYIMENRTREIDRSIHSIVAYEKKWNCAIHIEGYLELIHMLIMSRINQYYIFNTWHFRFVPKKLSSVMTRSILIFDRQELKYWTCELRLFLLRL